VSIFSFISFVKFVQDKDGDDEDSEDDGLEHDPAFDAPFEHRIVDLKEGSIFKVKYEIYEELGRGRFGVVFKVKDKENGEVLVIFICYILYFYY